MILMARAGMSRMAGVAFGRGTRFMQAVSYRWVCRQFYCSLLRTAPCESARADPVTVRGESTQTRKRLAEAEQKLIGGKTAEAIADIQRVLDDDADDLISVDGKELRPARFYAHQILAKLLPKPSKLTGDRIDQSALKLLEAGRKGRVPGRFGSCSIAITFLDLPEGIVLLGDLLFERR